MKNPNFPDGLTCITANHNENVPLAVAALIEQLENKTLHYHGFCLDCYIEYAGQHLNPEWFILIDDEIKEKILTAQLKCAICKEQFNKDDLQYENFVDEKGLEIFHNICNSCKSKLINCTTCAILTNSYKIVIDDQGNKSQTGPDIESYINSLSWPNVDLNDPFNEDINFYFEKYKFIYSCNKCIKQYCKTCKDCHGTFLSHTMVVNSQGQYEKCKVCFTAFTIRCKGCGTYFVRKPEVIEKMGLKKDSHDQWYCKQCIAKGLGEFPVNVLENGYSRVFEYNSNIIKILPRELHGDLYIRPVPRLFGLEMEFVMTTKPNDRVPVADMYKRMQGRGIIVRDGSIIPEWGKGNVEQFGMGFEVVSVPLIFENMLQFIEDVLDNNKLITDHKSCGIHIHVNKAKLTSAQVAKLLLFGRSPFNYRFLSAISERYIGPSNKYCPIDNRSWKDVLKATKPGGKYRGAVINTNGEHYHWLNFTKKDTIEFRIFASTVSIGKVKKNLEFIDALLDVSSAGTSKFVDFYTPNTLLDYVAKHRKIYPNLFHFIDGIKGFEKYYVKKEIKSTKIEQVHINNPIYTNEAGCNPYAESETVDETAA